MSDDFVERTRLLMSYYDEYSRLIAKNDDGRILIHTVLLPNEETGALLCDMSWQLIVATSNRDEIYYNLLKPSKWRRTATLITDHKGPISHLSTAYHKISAPHLTLFHAWMLPSDIPDYLKTVAAQAPSIDVPDDLKMTGPLHFVLPHWRDGQSVPNTQDDIFWMGVAPEPLRGLQSQLAGIAETFLSCTITTARGENWKAPHFTLLGRAKSEVPGLKPAEEYPVGPLTLAIGLSGRNGQFRGIIGTYGPERSTDPAFAAQNLRRFTS